MPAELGLFDEWTQFETVMRLFRFEDQAAGDAYLRAHHPVFYVRADAPAAEGAASPLASAPYKARAHAKSAREAPMREGFAAHGAAALAAAGAAFGAQLDATPAVPFAPLRIRGLECLQRGTACLGDCPDAAYFGPHVREDSDEVQMLRLETDDELHLCATLRGRSNFGR